MANGFPVKANYATGDVLTATNMNELSATVNYLQYMPPRNAVLNSAMNVWQRGTSVSIAASTGYLNTFGPDRWNTSTGANQATTISRQATGDTTNLPNIQYCARFQRNNGQTGTGQYNFLQNFESINSVSFAGKPITLSFYARAGANYSAASSILTANVYTGTGSDQNAFAGYTGQATLISQNATLTTTWQRFSYTATTATNTSQIGINFTWTPVGTAGAADYFEITGVQVELGSVANTYAPNQPTYQGELAACQRYYCRINSDNSTSSGRVWPLGVGLGSTSGSVTIAFPIPMRTSPTAVEYSSIRAYDTNSFITLTSITFGDASNSYANLTMNAASGFTQYRPVFPANNGTSAYIGFSAEL